MKAFAITWDGAYRNLMVATCLDIDDATRAVESARSDSGKAVAVEADLDLSGPGLVGLHNALSALVAVGAGENTYPNVSRFATRGDGQKRVFGLLEAHFKNAPEAAAPPTVDDAAISETPTNEDDMATKGKKTKTVKKAREKKERVAKTPREKKPAGEGKAVREGSSLAKLVGFMIDGNKTFDQMAKATDLRVDQVKHRIGQHLRVKNGIGHKVDADTKKVSIVFPKGFGAATIIAAKKSK